MATDEITYLGLRTLGFQIDYNHTDAVPHLTLEVNRQSDIQLEISPSPCVPQWIVWVRSNMTGNRGKFCYLRSVKTIPQLAKLIEAVTDAPPQTREFDRDGFTRAIDAEKLDCKRRYREWEQRDRQVDIRSQAVQKCRGNSNDRFGPVHRISESDTNMTSCGMSILSKHWWVLGDASKHPVTCRKCRHD